MLQVNVPLAVVTLLNSGMHVHEAPSIVEFEYAGHGRHKALPPVDLKVFPGQGLHVCPPSPVVPGGQGTAAHV